MSAVDKQLEKAERDLSAIRRKNLDLEDRIDDLLAGFDYWSVQKIGGLSWSVEDEMLARWVEHGDRSS